MIDVSIFARYGSRSGGMSAVAVWWLLCLVNIGLAEDEPAKPDSDAPISAKKAVAAYADAANLQNNGEFELAAEQWTEFLGNFGKDPLATSARHYLGVCTMQAEKFAVAAKWFQQAIDTQNATFDAIEETHLNLGWCYYSLGMAGETPAYAKAQNVLTQLVEQYPETDVGDQALFYLGECAYHQDQPRNAIAAYEKLVADYPESGLRPDALYAAIVTRQEAGEHDEASTSIATFLEDYPEHDLRYEIRIRQAESLLQQDKVPAAEDLFAELAKIKDFPSLVHVLVRQAYCAARMERYADAALLYLRVVESFGETPYAIDAQLGAGRCYFQLGDWQSAVKALSQIADGEGFQAAEAAHWLSRAYLENDEAKKALEVTEAAIARAADSPFLVDLKLDRGDALYAIDGQQEEAMSAFLDVSKQFPDSPHASLALYNAALTALEQEKYQDAEKYARQLVEQFSDDPIAVDAGYVMAESQLLIRRHEEAAAALARLVATHPEHPDVDKWTLRQGLALFLGKNYQQTIELLSEIAVGFDDQDAKAHAFYLIGTSHSHLGQDEMARDALIQSQQANPEWSQRDKVLLNLSRAMRKLGDHAKAEVPLQQMIASDRESALVDRAHYQLGELAFANEEFDTAVGHYGSLLKDFPESPLVPQALYGLGWSQIRNQDHGQAVQTLTRLIESGHAGQLLVGALQARAVCHRHLGDYESVLEDTAAWLDTKPIGESLATALYQRGLAAAKLKQTDLAVASLIRIVEEVEDYSSMSSVLYELAWVHQSAEDNRAALNWFQRLVDEYPEAEASREAAFHLGEGKYAGGEFADAVKWYAKTLEETDDQLLAQKAAYKLGWAGYRLRQYEEALVGFQRLLDEFPEGELTDESRFMIAECLFRLARYDEALPFYEQCRESLPKAEAVGVLTLLHGGQSAAQLKQWDAALGWFHAISANYPDSDHVHRAHYEEAWAHQNLGQTKQARDLYSEVADASRSAIGARARFMLGELLFEQQEFDSALKEFKRVMYGYGADAASKPAQLWQAKAGLEAGRCAAVLAGNARSNRNKTEYLQQAEKCFRYVMKQHGESEAARVAAGQLEKIGR